MKKIIPFLLIAFLWAVQACYKESYVPVEAKFTTEFKDADESVPVYVVLHNLSEGGDTYEWTFEGGTPETSSEKDKPRKVSRL